MGDADSPNSAPVSPPAGSGVLERADAATLRAVFNLTPTILSITDLDTGRFVDVNDAFVRVSGFSRAELIGRAVSEIGIWMDLGQREAGLALIRQGHQVRGVEARFRMKDGVERVMLLSGELMTLEGRACVVTALTDITDRTCAEEELRESERRFAQLFHANPLPMSIVSLGDGRHLAVNEAAVRHSGYSREEMLGRTKAELGFWVTPERRGEMLDLLRREGRARDFEVEFRARTGEVRQLLVNQEVIRYAGEPAVLSVSIDITERKQMEAQADARREEAEAFAEAAHLLAQSLDVGVVADEIVHRVRRLLRSSAALFCLLDAEERVLTVQSVSGDAGPLWKPGVTIPHGHALSWRAIREKRVVTSADLLADPDVRWTPELRERVTAGGYRVAMAAPLVLNARVVGALSVAAPEGRIYADKEIRLLEAFAAHAAVAVSNARLFHEVAAANRSKDEFLAMLGHELRNPLGTISNAVEVLDRVAADSTMQQVSGIVGRQVKLLTRLVDDLLDVARVASGKITVERRPVDLYEVAARCLDSLAQAGRTGDHVVRLEGGSAPVQGDASRLEQVVANLVDNALKYTPAGGSITVSASWIGPDVVLRVRDTGSGIRPEILPRVFDLFTQAPQALDRSRGGLGLGLALVKRLVELHGGSVSASSAGPGLGSEFTVRLPARTAVARSGEASGPSADAPAGPRRVLIVEDNADSRESLRLLLRLSGHEVIEAEDGAGALEQLAASRPDVALVDIGLPGIDGFEVARRVREQDPARSVLLVALTGYGQTEDRRRALDAGFDRHLTKPVDPATLLDLLRLDPAEAGTIAKRRA